MKRFVVEFQSLFFWNSPSKSTAERVKFKFRYGFNPCFSGTRPRSRKAKVNRCQIVKVSILVFLELALEVPYHGHTSRASSVSFNPCFSGTRPRSGNAIMTGEAIRYGFNPCFSGTRPRSVRCDNPLDLEKSFNPCFSGTRPRRISVLQHGK